MSVTSGDLVDSAHGELLAGQEAAQQVAALFSTLEPNALRKGIVAIGPPLAYTVYHFATAMTQAFMAVAVALRER